MIVAFTSVCREDFRWLHQYLREVERLNMPFVLHMDCCRTGARKHPLCLGYTSRYGEEFTEQHKQDALDLAFRKGADWALAWDIDETYEANFADEVQALCKQDFDWFDLRWLNLWETQDRVRVDNGFADGHRVKLYRKHPTARWVFDHPITNGPKLFQDGVELPTRGASADVVSLHWGMMTKELREEHKARWDRIYTAAVGANPYGFWNKALDESLKPITVKHGYF